MFWTISLLSSIASALELPIGIISTPFSDEALVDQLMQNLFGMESQIKSMLHLSYDIRVYWEYYDLHHEVFETLWEVPETFLTHDIKIILDISNDPIYSQFLAYEATLQNFLHIVVGRPIDELSGETPSSHTLYAETTFTSQAYAFIDIIKKYNWSQLGLIYSQDLNNVRLAEVFKENHNSDVIQILDELVVDSQDATASDRLSHRLESTTRDSGARVILVFTDPVLAAQLLHAGDQSVMGGSGYAWILNSNAMMNIGEVSKNSHSDLPSQSFGVLKTGSVGFKEEDGEYLRNFPIGSFYSVLTLSALAYDSLGFPNLPLDQATGSELRAFFMKNTSPDNLPYKLHFDAQGIKSTYYDLYNIKDFVEMKVGRWDSLSREVQITVPDGTITWPGFDTAIPDDKVPIIKIGLLYPSVNEYNENFLYMNSIINGFRLAIEEINKSTEVLNGYKIQGVEIDTQMAPNMASNLIKSVQNINILGFVGPYDNKVTKAFLAALSDQLDPKPLVSYGATATNFTATEDYPRFLRTIQPDGLQAVAVAMFIQQQPWKEIAVLYTDDEFGQGIYDSFLTNVETLEITIMNDKPDRIIKSDDSIFLSQEVKDDVEEKVTNLVRNQMKVIVYLGNYKVGVEVAKVAQSKELTGEYYSWVGAMWVTEECIQYINSQYPDDKDNIFEVYNNAVGLGYRLEDPGPEGQAFASAYLTKYGEEHSTFAMLAYDSTYLFGRTISGMIERGEDFNDGKELIDALRAADFSGASGKVKFSEGTNDRSAFGYSIVNIIDDKIVHVTEYDPLNPNMFTSELTIQWNDGIDSPADDDWGFTYDCPFARHMSSVSVEGLITVIAIGTFMMALTLFLSIVSYRKWKQVEIQPITEPVVRSWKDTLVQATILIEFFQFIAIAPSFLSLKVVIEAASNVFMLDIMKVAQEDTSTYWTLLVVICCVCYFWFFLVLCIMSNAEHWLKKVALLQRTLSMLNAVYLPFFGNTMFLPFTALLLDGYVCDHYAQGHQYVWRDCYMNCWTDRHYPYVIMSAIALACYEPIAVFSRPLWQQAKTGLNLMAKPLFLLFKTCVQVLLIAVGKSLQGIFPVVHGAVFSILVLAFTVITYRLQPFNYHRCNLWEVSSLFAVFYMSVLATISLEVAPEHIAWFIVLMIGWGMIGGVTFLIQRKYYPNLLVPPGGAKNKRKVYDALAFRRVRDSASADMDNSAMGLKSSTPNPPDVSVDHIKDDISSPEQPIENKSPPSDHVDHEDISHIQEDPYVHQSSSDEEENEVILPNKSSENSNRAGSSHRMASQKSEDRAQGAHPIPPPIPSPPQPAAKTPAQTPVQPPVQPIAAPPVATPPPQIEKPKEQPPKAPEAVQEDDAASEAEVIDEPSQGESIQIPARNAEVDE